MSTIKMYHREAIYTSVDELKSSMILEPFDELAIPLKSGEIVTAVFGGYVKGGRRRFVLKDCVGEARSMYADSANVNGYFNSDLRRYVLEDLLPLFPEQLIEAFIPRPMSEIIDGERREYEDALWVPSATDVFGAGEEWEEEADSEQLEIFKRERDRVKELTGRGTWFWWLRSPRRSISTSFVYVSTNGSVNYTSASYSYGVAPGFDL